MTILGVNSGQLNFNSNRAVGTGNFTIGSGSFLDNTSGAPIVNANNSPLTLGSFTFVGSNDLDLGNGAIALGNAINRAITVNGSANLTLRGVATGSGAAMSKTGTGTLTLFGASTNTNAVFTLTAGRLNINHTNAIGRNSVALTIAGPSTLGNTGSGNLTLTNHAVNLNADFAYDGTG